MTSLLLVEDDRELTALLVRALTEEGYDVTAAADGHTALHLGLTRSFDLMVVDRGLPAVEGLDLVSRLRSKGIVSPLLILSARGSAQDRIDGLDSGAEDYLTKPFDLGELLARLRALSRRRGDGAEVLQVPGGSFEAAVRAVTLDDGEVVSLSEREADLLAVLAGRPSQVFGRSALLSRVFGEAESENVVDTYVHYLRRKLGSGVVRTVRGLGYQLGSG